QSLTVRWTDGREDVCSDGIVQPRERIDNLVHQALNVCENKEQLMNLLSSMQPSFIKAIHLFPAWLRLYGHLSKLPYFDVTISQYLFERLQEVNMESYGAALVQFIFDLFNIWPSLSDNHLLNLVRDRIVQLIRVLIMHKTQDSNVLIEKLTERICANTPAQNIRGHLCFFLLLSDLLPKYYEAGLSGAIKKIDKNILLWYADLVLADNNAEVSGNHSALMIILKYMSMYTEYNLLREWFDRMATRPNDLICFQLIEYSLCPTTILAT
ncbi:unnamed protein product, partial [Rotaria sp. Silwood2]